MSNIRFRFDLCVSGSVLGSYVMGPLIGLLFVLRSVSAVRLLYELEAESDI